MALETHGAGGVLVTCPRVWWSEVECWVREPRASSLFSLQVFISTILHLPSPTGAQGPARCGCSRWGVSMDAGARVPAKPDTALHIPLNHLQLKINQDE